LRTETVALGEPAGAGTGTIERRAIIEARVKAQVVKNPKVVWRRLRALCMFTLDCWPGPQLYGFGRNEERRYRE
jgi:hypothetical protein